MLVLVAVLGASLFGCASVDPAPFTQFADGLKNLRNGVDAQAATDAQNEKARFIEKVEAGEIPPFDLQLAFPGDQRPGPNEGSAPPFDYKFESGSEPLYMKLEHFRSALGALNDAMVSYAGLLAKLAGDEVVDPTRFKKLTEDINANATSAANALGIKGSGDAVALLSSVAVRIFQGIIDKKRREDLSKAIAETHGQVEMFSDKVQEAISFLATGVTTNYDDRINPLINLPPPATKATIDAILKLNSDTQKTMDTLGTLYRAYGQLPEAHADLEQAVNKRPGALTGLLDFTNEAVQLHARYLELKAANEAAAASGG